jgi:GT2 family glycosyltransferase
VRVSIVHWNRPAECVATVEALQRQPVELDIVVIDNDSMRENYQRLVERLPAGVEVVRLPANVGWGPAHNVALRRWLSQESSEYCVVCAHDALPESECLSRLMAALDGNTSWGMACPEHRGSGVPTYSVVRGARLQAAPDQEAGTCQEVAYCHGTLALFRRQCLREIGVYDEAYFAYGDETEIGIRARRLGWKVGLVWGAVVINPGSWSGSAVIGYLWTRSSLRLARTYGGRGGLCLRAGYIALATCVLWLKRASTDSLSSPRARMLAIRDYLRGYQGPPPADLALKEPA